MEAVIGQVNKLIEGVDSVALCGVGFVGGFFLLFMCPWYLQFPLLVALIVYLLAFGPVHTVGEVSRSVQYGVAGAKEGVPRRNILDHTKLVTKSLGCSTIGEFWNKVVEINGSRPCLGDRKLIKIEKVTQTLEVNGKQVEKVFSIPHMEEYKFETYEQINKKVKAFGAGMYETGLKPKELVSIFSGTRKEWQISAQACWAHGFPIVTLYPSLGEEALVYGFNQTELTHLICEAELVGIAVTAAASCPALKVIIYTDTLPQEKIAEYEKKGLRLFQWDKVCEFGAAMTPPKVPPVPEDLAVIMYTSGSTGNPKGVMVSQANLMANVAGLECLPIDMRSEDVYIAYLPLAHILEMSAEMLLFSKGACVGYSSPRTLNGDGCRGPDGQPLGDISALRPTIMAAVPAILDKIRASIEGTLSKASKGMQFAFKAAMHLKKRQYMAGKSSPILDKIIFSKIKAKFGGRLKFVISGGAPLSQDTQTFINLVLTVPVLQGYGLTETCASGTICHQDDRTFGRVGAPVPSCEIKLVDVEEMNYTSADKPFPRGEILIRGGPVTMGYYKNPEATAEVFRDAEDGGMKWFSTGDIGQWHADGTLAIIDRKKDLVKMVQGEYIALGKLEALARNSIYVDNVCVYANPLKSFPVCVIVPNQAALTAFAATVGVNSSSLSAMVTEPKLIAEVLRSITNEFKAAKCHKFEYVEQIMMTADEWTPANGMLTEAMKLKRHPVTHKYKPQLEALYK